MDNIGKDAADRSVVGNNTEEKEKSSCCCREESAGEPVKDHGEGEACCCHESGEKHEGKPHRESEVHECCEHSHGHTRNSNHREEHCCCETEKKAVRSAGVPSCCGGREEKHTGCCCGGHEEHESGGCCGGSHPGGCCGGTGGNVVKEWILLGISLVFLVAGFFEWKHIFVPFYYFNPAYVTVAISGFPIFRNAIAKLRHGKITSSLLISVAMVASIALEIVGFFYDTGMSAHSHSYIFAAGEIAFLMSIGELIENITVRKTRSGIERLVGLIPKVAYVKTENGLEETPLSEISIGDRVVVKAGEMIAVDGVIVSGSTSIDQSSVTGEYLPVEAGAGSQVYGGTFNQSGVIEIEVTKRLEDMTVAKMAQLVEEAEGKKAPISKIADRWAGYIVPSAIVLAVIVGLLSAIAFGLNAVDSIIRATTVLVVFCPCSLALATPTAIAAGLGNAAKNGVLIKSGESLEIMSSVDTVCFDKTGTLTSGKIRMTDVAADGMTEDEVIAFAAAVEKYSEHPLARAVTDKAEGIIPEAKDVRSLHGAGVEGTVDGQKVLVCSLGHARESGYDTDVFSEFADRVLRDGKTVAVCIIDGKIAGVMAFSDTLRDEAKDALDTLNRRGYNTVMLTGDNTASAEFVANQLKISSVYASLMPEDKLNKIEELKQSGSKVCYLGDGINDAPSLKAADCSIAMGALGCDIAIETADMAILNSNLNNLNDTLRLSKRTLRTIKRNIVISMSINALAVFASLMGWLTPVTGALVHNVSSVFVVLSSALLLRNRK
ncbi:MAG: heavy metal translocating P-type ATPase [Christensenellales bacterium]